MINIFEFRKSQYRTYKYEKFCDIIDLKSQESRYLHRGKEIFQPTKTESFSEDEEEYVKNYANPFSSIYHNKIIVNITKNEEKICLKFYTYLRCRNVNSKFFKKETRIRYLTYNFKTNALYDGFIVNYHKKRKFVKKVRKNQFWSFPLEKIIGEISSILNSFKITSDIINKGQFLFEIEKKFFENIPNYENYSKLKGSQKLYKIFADKYGIKLPNNWDCFFGVYPYIKIKDLRKHDMKFINCFMNINNLTGDKIKKNLHKINKFTSANLFKWACNFFGTDYILGQDDNFLIKLLETEDGALLPFNNIVDMSEVFKKSEKYKILKIFKICLDEKMNFSTFYDHIYMLNFVNKYEKIKWGPNSFEEFLEEHSLLTNKVSFYKNGHYNRYYNSEFISCIEETFNDMYPVLLKNNEEYNNESFVQSNCVKRYIDKPSSIIISLRKGSKESNERATIEFYLFKEEGQIKTKVIQKLGKFNSPLNENWNENIKTLEIKFNKLIEKDIFKLYDVIYKTGLVDKKLSTKFYEITDNYELYSNDKYFKPSIGQIYYYETNSKELH